MGEGGNISEVWQQCAHDNTRGHTGNNRY